MSDRFTSCGKQVLKDGEHFADARNPGTAEAITIMLNHGRVFSGDITDGDVRVMREELWT